MSFEPIISSTAEDPAEVLARLGAVLVEGGTIDRRTLDRAGRVAVETGGRLDHVLTQLGLVSERGLAEALAQLIEAPLVEAGDYPDAPLFLDRLKVKFLRKVRALPIAATNGRATLAMADPLDVFTRNAVAAALGHPVMVECRRHRVTGKDIKWVGHSKGRTTVGSRNRQRAHLAQELVLQPIE